MRGLGLLTLTTAYTVADAGTWALLNRSLTGSASGTAVPATVAQNIVNTSISINNIVGPSGYTLPGAASWVAMYSKINGAANVAAHAQAQIINARYIFTFEYTPDSGKTIAEDPPTDFTVVLTLRRFLRSSGITGTIPATISSSAKLTAYGISFPELNGSASGEAAQFDAGDVDEDVKIIKTITASGQTQENLTVYFSMDTVADYEPDETGGGGGGGPGGLVLVEESLQRL